MSEDENSTNPSAPATPTIPIKPDNEDAEIRAMNTMVSALSPLKEEQRLRALEYVLRRFNAVALQGVPVAAASPALQPTVTTPVAAFSAGVPATMDIRMLKETKQPKSANEMAALVAYYVSELAPPGDRKNEITTGDIERYFKSAGFALPGQPRFTLVNAKNAGYLDSTGGGQYKLNPVGYNLVVHRMGTGEGANPEPRRRAVGAKRRKKPAKKSLHAKK